MIKDVFFKIMTLFEERIMTVGSGSASPTEKLDNIEKFKNQRSYIIQVRRTSDIVNY